MADFGQVDSSGPINPWTTYYESQQGSNRSIAAQQDMADRATLRGLAPGLATRDPGAVADAVVLPVGAPSVATLGSYDSQAAASKLAELEYKLKFPVGGDVVPGGPGADAGGARGGASHTAYVPGTPFVPKNLPAGISPDEDAMVRTVAGEASGQPLDGQVGVASVIKNRSASAGVSPQAVVFSPQQFSPWNGGDARARLEAMDPASPEYQRILNGVVRPVMAGKVADPTKGATHFYAPAGMAGGAPPSWAVGQTPTAEIGGHKFYGLGYGPAATQVAAGDPAGFAPVTPVAGAPGSAAAPAAAAPTPLPDDHNHDHAISVSGGLMQAILDAPPEQRAGMWAKYRPIMLQAGAVNAPVDYPGDQVAAAMRDSAFNPQVRAAHLAAIRAPGSVQVAGPGAGPPAAPMSSDSSSMGAGAPAPAVGGVPAPVSVAPEWTDPAAFAARNGGAPGAPAPAAPAPAAAAAPPPVPNENPLLAMAAPAGAAAAPPANALLPPAAPAARPTFMPAASAAAPPAASAAASSLDPPPGAVKAMSPLGTPFPGAGPGMALYQVPGHKGLMPFRDPAVPEPFETKEVGGQMLKISKLDGRLMGTTAIPDARRSLQNDENGMHVVRNADGQILSSTPIGEYKIATEAYGRDSKEIAAIADAGRSAQADQIRLQSMRDILRSNVTGAPAKQAMAMWVQRNVPNQLGGDFLKKLGGLPDASALEEFSKLALTGAGTQERGVLGGRGGFQAIRLFQQANPSNDLQTQSNEYILAKQLIGDQADLDYSLGAQGHFATQETRLGSEGKYRSQAQFDRDWTAQRNPQVYAGAIGALAGQPVAKWADGLSAPEYERALHIVSRADPSATVQGKTGPLSMQPNNGGRAAPVAPPLESRTVGKVYPSPKGDMTWTGTGWVPAPVH